MKLSKEDSDLLQFFLENDKNNVGLITFNEKLLDKFKILSIILNHEILKLN